MLEIPTKSDKHLLEADIDSEILAIISNYSLGAIIKSETLTTTDKQLMGSGIDKYVGQTFLDYIPIEIITNRPVAVIGSGQIGSWIALFLAKYNPSVLDIVDFNSSQITNCISRLIECGYNTEPYEGGKNYIEINIKNNNENILNRLPTEIEDAPSSKSIIGGQIISRPIKVSIEGGIVYKGIPKADLPIEYRLKQKEILVSQSKFDFEVGIINMRVPESFRIDVASSTNFEKLSLLKWKGYKIENIDDRDSSFIISHPITIRGIELDITDLKKLEEFFLAGYFSIADATSSAGLFGYNKGLGVSIFEYNSCLKHALGKSGLFSFVKVGTQGCGGMDPDHIPYTHSERGTKFLLQKQANAFSTQQMLVDSAKHPSNPRLGYIRPETAVGPLGNEVVYGVVKKREIRKNEEKNCLESSWRELRILVPYLYELKEDNGMKLHLEDQHLNDYGVFENTYIDSGENGFFGLGDYEAISYADSKYSQMGYVHPARVAEITSHILLGYPSKYNILSNGIEIPPSYYSGIQRGHILSQFKELETDETIPFLGNLGSHRLWSIAGEAFIIKKALISIGKSPTYQELLKLSLEETSDLMGSWIFDPKNKRIIGKIITTEAKIYTNKGIITSEIGISEIKRLFHSCNSLEEKNRLCASNCVHGWINTTNTKYKDTIPRSETKILRTGPYALLSKRLPTFLKRKMITLNEEISPGKLVALTFIHEDLGYRGTL